MPVDVGARFSVRSYRDGDETAILDLFRRCFHADRTIDHWRWKYKEDPFGNERISVAWSEDRLVGHYAGYPVPFAVEKEVVDANHIGDTMTDPSVRHLGRGPTGVLGSTALHFYEHFCEGRVAFNYGFNVANIQKFSLRFLRSTRVENVAYRIRDLRANPLLPLRRLERYARGISLELVRDTSPQWDQFFARVSKHYPFLVRRDARYVSWRYLTRPDLQYVVIAMRKWTHLAGWLVLRVRDRHLSIGDLLLDPDHADVLEPALRHVVHLFDVDAIDLWCPPRPRWMHDLLSSLRFVQTAEPQNLSVMCVPFMDPHAPERMAESLYYTMGDSDLF